MNSAQATRRITTEDLARMVGVKGPSIRTALSLKGHYWGLKPIKAPNGRLLWNEEDVEALLNKAS